MNCSKEYNNQSGEHAMSSPFAEGVKRVVISRGSDMRIILLRQLPHDKQVRVGGKLKYGSGRAWEVVSTGVPLTKNRA